jgi:hypothetical protein
VSSLFNAGDSEYTPEYADITYQQVRLLIDQNYTAPDGHPSSSPPTFLRRFCLYFCTIARCYICGTFSPTEPLSFLEYDSILKRVLCSPKCRRALPVLNASDIKSKYGLTPDDLAYVTLADGVQGIPFHTKPNPYFKHVPMNLWY